MDYVKEQFDILRGGAVVARQAHNLKANGSIPFPATIFQFQPIEKDWLFSFVFSRLRPKFPPSG